MTGQGPKPERLNASKISALPFPLLADRINSESATSR
jgi:hypothetical protein